MSNLQFNSFKDYIIAIKKHVELHGFHPDAAGDYYYFRCRRTNHQFSWNLKGYDDKNNRYDAICKKHIGHVGADVPCEEWLKNCIEDKYLDKLIKLKAFE